VIATEDLRLVQGTTKLLGLGLGLGPGGRFGFDFVPPFRDLAGLRRSSRYAGWHGPWLEKREWAAAIALYCYDTQLTSFLRHGW